MRLRSTLVKFLDGMETLNKKFIVSFLIVLAFFVFLFFLNNKLPDNFRYLKISNVVLKVELANTFESQTLGLSGRENLKEKEGMLFVFDHLDRYAFWMKDMNFPIDIIWLDENKKIIHIERDVRPESYPTTFGPDQRSLYVLEVVSGFADKYNLKIGDGVSF